MSIFAMVAQPFKKHLLAYMLSAAALMVAAVPAGAQVMLRTAADFAVLAGLNVTCTAGVVTGDIGVAPGSAVSFTNTGCTIAGATPPATNAAAVQARTDFLNAYAALQARAESCVQVPGNMAGLTLGPGVYCTDAVAKAGTLTLSGPSNGVWIFLVNGALTGTNFAVVMAGGGQPCNVFWAPTAAATMTTSAFKGNILAGDNVLGAITLTGGSVAGRVLANVAVTMTGASVIDCGTLRGTPSTCGKKRHGDDDHEKCNQGVGNGAEGCDPGKSNHGDDANSNDERGGKPGSPGRKGGGK